MEASIEPEADSLARRLTSGQVLLRSVVLQLLGQGMPLLVAFVALPRVVQALGPDRVGIVTLAWAAIGSFSLFDLGLGRALTQRIATSLGRREPDPFADLFWNSSFLMLAFGFLGAASLSFLAPWMVRSLFHIPERLSTEAIHGIYLLSFTLPAMIHTAGMSGMLAAHQRFGVISALRAVMGALMFLGPLAVLPFSRDLVPVIGTLAASRILGWLAHLVYCFRTFPDLRRRRKRRFTSLLPLLRFGGWMTVSNVINPLLIYLDRFMLGALVPVSRIAFYAVPYEIVTKLWILPGAVASVLFPAFATSLSHDPDRTELLYRRAVKYTLFAVFPLVLIVISLAPEGLRWWLGEEFAAEGTTVVRWLALGVFLNSLAQMPVGLLQGAGRPDVVAKLQCLEAPFYVTALWLSARAHGIEGAAAAWTLRIAVDGFALFYLVHRLGLVRPRFTSRGFLLLAGFAVLSSGLFYVALEARWSYLLVTLFAFFLAAWCAGLSADERRFFTSHLRSRLT